MSFLILLVILAICHVNFADSLCGYKVMFNANLAGSVAVKMHGPMGNNGYHVIKNAKAGSWYKSKTTSNFRLKAIELKGSSGLFNTWGVTKITVGFRCPGRRSILYVFKIGATLNVKKGSLVLSNPTVLVKPRA